ncbi:hypothetical protein [Macrococcus sp. S115]|uniref:hypothetical protein n=1 Tax=Macrococcus sp. S115 TaxID=3047480 RepID=UPI0024BD1078|nr:hypothetical protein [Macrococcus sp. S115]MDJ1111452.1 hypothetical protein [Macrococcus sp. S115]
MIIYLKESEFIKLFNHYMNKGWYTDKTDKRNGNIYYSLIDDTYRVLDVSGEVYVEEFNNAQEMHAQYDERVHEQVTIFDY